MRASPNRALFPFGDQCSTILRARVKANPVPNVFTQRVLPVGDGPPRRIGPDHAKKQKEHTTNRRENTHERIIDEMRQDNIEWR